MKLDVYFAACMAAGLLLRLVDVGETPLGGEEAVAAWAAWTSVAGGPPVPLPAMPQSALLHGILASTFWLVGAGDAAARVPVALLSMSPLLLLWRAAPVFGTVAAVTLAALLAFDPVSIGYSRLADSTALSAAAAWAVIICAACASSAAVPPAARAGWTNGVRVAAGIGLVSGPLAWDVAFPLSLLLIVLLPTGSGSAARPIAAVAVTAVIAGSAALTRWDGIQYVSSGATHWLSTWSGGAGRLTDVWLDALRLEIVPVAAGIAGLALALVQRDGRAPTRVGQPLFSPRVFVALVVWMVWGVFVALRPGRSLSAWIVVQPPLFLGACYLAATIAAAARDARRPHARLTPWAALSALALLQFAGAGVQVAAGDHPSRFRPYPAVAEPGVRHLARDVGSLLASGDRRLDVVAAGGADPLLGWHLRDAPGLHWVAAAPVRQPGLPARYAVIPSPAAGMHAGDVAVYPVRRRAGALEWVRLQQVGGGS